MNAILTTRFADQPVCTTVWKLARFTFTVIYVLVQIVGELFIFYAYQALFLGESCQFPIEECFTDTLQVGPGPCKLSNEHIAVVHYCCALLLDIL